MDSKAKPNQKPYVSIPTVSKLSKYEIAMKIGTSQPDMDVVDGNFSWEQQLNIELDEFESNKLAAFGDQFWASEMDKFPILFKIYCQLKSISP